MFNSFNASVTGVASTSLLAISDIFGEADRIGELSAQKLLALIVVVSWIVVVVQNRRSDKANKAESRAHKEALSELMAHHNGAVITMNAERAEVRATLVGLVVSNTAATTQLAAAVNGLSAQCKRCG